MLSLQHPYIAVSTGKGESYGGGQQYSDNAMVRRCGCGIIAAADLLLYLSRWHLQEPPAVLRELLRNDPLPFSEYYAWILWMNRHYFPMIPYAGINGLMLMAGMEKFSRDYRLPYTARWCFASHKLWNKMEDMLRQDIPAILAVGPNFPIIWGNKRVRFYIKAPDGRYVPASGAKAHYFTVTGIDDSWLRISSWGRMYFLNRWEYLDYVRKYSSSVASNMLFVERK